MPRGIWTIESSESRPPRCCVGIGTPMTGRMRLRGEHPGQVGRAARARRRSPGARARRGLRVAEQVVRRPMRRHDLQLRGHAQLLQHARPPSRAPGSPSGCRPTHARPAAVGSRHHAASRRRRGARALQRLVLGVSDPPSRGPSCGARRPAACRRRGRGRPGRASASSSPRASPAGPRRCPSRLTIAARPVRRRRTQRQPADRADVLLELGGQRALDRPVARVVDPRRELVDDERWSGITNSSTVSSPTTSSPRASRPAMPIASPGDDRADRRRRDRLDQHAAVVDVARDREGHGPPVAIARDDHRDLRLEASSRSSEQRPLGRRRRAPPRPRPRPPGSAIRTWPPAVVAADRRLEPERVAQLVGGRAQVRASERTARHGATGSPRPWRNRRSASRSWVTRSVGRPGRTGDPRRDRARRIARRRARARTSRPPIASASWSAASTSSYPPTITSSATAAAGHSRIRVEDRDPIAEACGPRARASGPAGRRRGSRSSRRAGSGRRSRPAV